MSKKVELRREDLLTRIARSGNEGVAVTRLVEETQGDALYPEIPSIRKDAIDHSVRVLAKRGDIEVAREDKLKGTWAGNRKFWRVTVARRARLVCAPGL